MTALDSTSGMRVWLWRATWLLLAALVGLLALFWFKFLYNGYLTAIFPGQIDYGEGIVWQQARLIPGPRMYGDLNTYPYIVFHYPPVYHLTVHALAALGMPWLAAGRAVSILSTLAIALLAAAFTYEALSDMAWRPGRLAGALIAGLLLVTLKPIQVWAYTMRVDMLAVALEFAGLYLGLRSLRQPNLIWASAAMFVAAAFTKQTMIEGAFATVAVLLLHRPRRAAWAALFAALLGGGIFVMLTLVTKGGFPKHTIFYNINPFTWRAVYDGVVTTGVVTLYPVYLVLALVIAAVLGLRLLRGRLRAVPAGRLIVFLYFLLTTANLLSLGKEGSWINYLIPWVCSWVLLIGLAVGEIADMAQRGERAFLLPALFLLLLAQALATPKFGERKVVDPQFRREYLQLVAMIRDAQRPVFSEDMVLLMQADKYVPWEPTIITDLSRKGMFDERKAIRRIEARQFAYVIREKYNFRGERFSPAMEAAIAKAYPVERTLAGLRVLSPAGPAS